MFMQMVSNFFNVDFLVYSFSFGNEFNKRLTKMKTTGTYFFPKIILILRTKIFILHNRKRF